MSTNLNRRFRKSLAALTLAFATAIGVVGVGGTAHASYNNTSLDAACDHRGVTAYAPNLQASPWSVSWAPTLYQYTTAGWRPYLYGATQYQSSASWDISQVIFSNLPPGYYQVRDSYQWLYNGQNYGALTRNVPVAHHLEGASWTLSYNELRLSTSSYCYAD